MACFAELPLAALLASTAWRALEWAAPRAVEPRNVHPLGPRSVALPADQHSQLVVNGDGADWHACLSHRSVQLDLGWTEP